MKVTKLEEHKKNQCMRTCNMKIQDIIEGLNKHIEEIRRGCKISTKGHIVLHKTIEPCSFKAYKKYSAELIYVNPTTKSKASIGKVDIVDKVLEGQEEKMLSKVTIDLVQLILKFVNSDLFDKIIKGENI